MSLIDDIRNEICTAYSGKCAEEKEVLTEAADPNTYILVMNGKEQKFPDAKTFSKTILSRINGDKKQAQKDLEDLMKEGGEAGFTIRNSNKLQSITAKVELGLEAASRKDQRAADKANKMAQKLDGKYKFAAVLENGVVKIFLGSKELFKLPNGEIAKQAVEPMMKQIEDIIKEEKSGTAEEAAE